MGVLFDLAVLGRDSLLKGSIFLLIMFFTILLGSDVNFQT